MSTRSTLETETQRLLDDTAADAFTTAEIDTYLDEAQLVFNRRARIWKTGFLLVTVANQELYRLQPSGSVVQVYVTAAGGTHSATDTVTFSAAPTGGTTAGGTIVVSGATLAGVILTDSGSRYVATPTITFSAGTGTANAVLNGSYGAGNPPVGPVERLFTGREEAPGVLLRPTSDGRLDVLLSTTTTDWTAATAGTPTRWIQKARDYAAVRLWPTPSGAAAYTALAAGHPPSLGNASQEPVIPAHYHPALPFYAAWRCLVRLGDANFMELATAYLQDFDKAIEQASAEMKERAA